MSNRNLWISGPAAMGMTSYAAEHYRIGAVYWDADLEVPFTVTDMRWHGDLELWAVVRADLDYPCYGQTQRIFTVRPGMWSVHRCINADGVI